MHLKKLELVGFKSFFNKAALNFEEGITAVVGPNGCGKSNIFDSIRWVLGEQSVKALRGSDMQDVIFNGTDSKESLSMAEVTLTFDNNSRFFNVDHDEVAITRRIFRSGESEYLLNKSLVRLRDILDLLMGTGIGAESYSLVAQGKIDLVLSSRPEDRRLVFDEASGITKYKQQKKEAARRLEETEQNLLRVNDIILEVKRQIGSLERQANKARRYKEIFEELRHKEITLAVLEKIKLLKEKDEIIGQLSGLEGQELKLMGTIHAEESRMSNRQAELQALQDKVMEVKNEILNSDNLVSREKERISFNQQNSTGLDVGQARLKAQVEQLKSRILLDEEKLNNLRQESSGIQKNIEAKKELLKEKEQQFNLLCAAIKTSLENVSKAKKGILETVTKITNIRNESTDSIAKQQVQLSRKRRLELEKAKAGEEKSAVESNLKDRTQELEGLKRVIEDLNRRILGRKCESEQEGLSLEKVDADLERIDRQILALDSHKELIEKLKTRYDDIGESLNAVIYLDKFPREEISGLVIKIKEAHPQELKLFGEAKPFDLDTQKIEQKLIECQKESGSLKNIKQTKESRIEELNKIILQLQEELREQDIALANKKSTYEAVWEQFNKIKEEEEVIVLELGDIEKELAAQEEKISGLETLEAGLEKEHKKLEEAILDEQNEIGTNSNLKEEVLVKITQTKTELEALAKRIHSDEATLKIWEDTYNVDQDNLLNIERQLKENAEKKESLASEIKGSQNMINEALRLLEDKKILLKEKEDIYRKATEAGGQLIKNIESFRKEHAAIKNKLYELQMHNKDVDFKFLSIKERILQNYKVDLEAAEELMDESNEDMLSQDIQRLKEKLDSQGTVNLVAIEEYDELKKRYDFLIQQQNDLTSAKESLHEAILKINRTTKKMFLETFELVAREFRNYFRLLFNGGDAQVFLIDEQDPLDSGIEIICRPPGKKLQNVLLLSGGEKSLSAIALIFAIFKVKPSPFCILDEIDAALDEANVDRFSRLLQEFAKQSQFIVITHNKRTIANADVMYGITMENSGISKIVSVKFAKEEEKEPLAVAEPV